MFSSAVLTSKPAQKDLEKIKASHELITKGIADQTTKVNARNQQKQAELANKNSMKMEMDKEKMVADTTTQKNAMDFSIKQSELDIKRAALSLSD